MKRNDLLRRLLRPYRWRYYSLPLLGALGAAAGLAAPAIQKNFINHIDRGNAVWFWLLLALLCFGVASMTAGIIRYLDERLKAQVSTDLKSMLVEKLLELPGDFFLRHPSGYLAARIEFDTVRMGYFYSYPPWQLVLSAVSAAGACAVLFSVRWPLALAFALLAPVYLLLLRKFRRRCYELNRESCEIRAASHGFLRTLLGNIRTVKTHVRESAVQTEVKQQYDRLFGVNLRIIRLNVLLTGVMRSIPALAKLAILLFGIQEIRRGNWSLGEVWALLGYTSMVFAPALVIAGLLMEREAAGSASDRVLELLERLPEENLSGGIVPERLQGAVEGRSLCFSYQDGRPVFENFSFAVPAGSKTAILGASGSGKSTLMSLLLALYRPQSGEILFDGVPAARYNLRELRRRIGYVSQSPQFFPGTLARNLSSTASVDEIRSVLCEVGAPELTGRLEEPVVESAENFSTGERVRLALARELLRRTDIVFLDEPTANLDAGHEAELMRTFSGVLRHKTVFLVTHKAELVEYCDRVIRLRTEAGGEKEE